MPKKKTLEHYLRQLRLIEEHRELNCEKNVRRYYRQLKKDLEEFLGTQYAKLAIDDKLTYEILHSKKAYARFLEEIEQRTSIAVGKAAKDIKKTVQDTYKAAFDGMVDAVQKSKNYEELKANLNGLKAATPDVIKNAVSNTFLEDALEKNHRTVIYDIKQQIGIGLSLGDRMSTMARRISEQLDKDYKKATLIARTETHRIREAGYQDSSERISQTLQDNNSDYVMIKTWKTMKDGAVRPQRLTGKGKNKKIKMGKGANHVKMHGVTVLADEFFDLGDGNKAKAPGQSGVAGHDINCRCYLSRDLVTKEEYEEIKKKQLSNSGNSNIIDGEKVDSLSVDRYPADNIILPEDGTVSKEFAAEMTSAIDEICTDMKISGSFVDNVRFDEDLLNTESAFGISRVNVDTDTGQYKISISFDKNLYSDEKIIMRALTNDYKNGESYKTSTAKSLIAHELGHSIHNKLTLQNLGVKNNRLTTLDIARYQKERANILVDLYKEVFGKMDDDAIKALIIAELGEKATDPFEFIAQSFGNYYFGDTKSKVAKKVVRYFKRRLK